MNNLLPNPTSLPRPGAPLAVVTSEHPVVLWHDRGTLRYAPINASGLVLWKQHDEVDTSTFDQSDEEHQLRTRAEHALHTAQKPDGSGHIDVEEFSGTVGWNTFIDGCKTYRGAAEKHWEHNLQSPGTLPGAGAPTAVSLEHGYVYWLMDGDVLLGAPILATDLVGWQQACEIDRDRSDPDLHAEHTRVVSLLTKSTHFGPAPHTP